MSERHESDRYRPIESLELEMRDRLAAKDAEISRLNAALARVRGQRDYLGPIAHERLEQQGGKEYANGCLSLVGLRIINGTVEEIES